jgi:hypothetical protein
MYGLQIPKSVVSTPERSVIGPVESSQAGNIILRVGREQSHGWSQREHVVLTPREAFDFALRILTEVQPHLVAR